MQWVRAPQPALRPPCLIVGLAAVSAPVALAPPAALVLRLLVVEV